MALTTTTLSAAVTVTDNSIQLTSATGVAVGYLILVDQEVFQVGQSWVSGTTIPVTRGRNGTVTAAHVSGANAVIGAAASDFSAAAPQVTTGFPIAGRAKTVTSYSAAGAITLPTPGNDAVAILNGTTILAMTIADPTKDMDGCELTIVGNGAAAHTLTFASGLSGAGSSYDVFTVNATAPVAIKVVAINGYWTAFTSPAWTGTVTALVGGIA